MSARFNRCGSPLQFYCSSEGGAATCVDLQCTRPGGAKYTSDITEKCMEDVFFAVEIFFFHTGELICVSHRVVSVPIINAVKNSSTKKQS